MAALEKIMQMKQQGFTEPQIIEALKQEGVSPREIDEGLSQSSIKSEINPQQPGIIQNPAASNTISPTANIQQQVPMQPSISQTNQPVETPIQQPMIQQPMIQQPVQPIPQSIQQPIAYEQQEQYPEYQQPYYDEYASPSSDISTINDVAEQIVEEKTTAIKKQISGFTKFKEELTLDVEKINEKLNRIENTFNELQIAILKKVGEYGEGMQNIEKEMHTTQDSFSKMVNPLTDNIRELQKITGLKTKSKPGPKPKTRGKKKEKINFEDYLR